MSGRPEAGSPCAHFHGFAAEPLLGGSRLPCGQLASRVESRQKQRLGDIRVKLQ